MRIKPVVFTAALLLVLGLWAVGSAEIRISEVMASNGWYENGHAWDWVELRNDGKESVNLSGWFFSDSEKNPLKWAFPEGTKLKKGACLTVFCTGEEINDPGKGDTFYTDFALSSKGETVVLKSEAKRS